MYGMHENRKDVVPQHIVLQSKKFLLYKKFENPFLNAAAMHETRVLEA
jgi:hypothetical protein